jgi:RNA-binding protein 26
MFYSDNGYCARGAMCKYSHGDDAVIPSQLYPMDGGPSSSGLHFMPMFPGNSNGMPFMQGAAYDPHEARMDMRPTTGRNHQRAPLLPRIQQEDGRVIHPINASGELPVIQDLTPTVYPDVPDNPADDPTPQIDDVDMSQTNNQAAPKQMNNFNPMLGPTNGNSYSPAVPSIDVDMAGPSDMRPPVNRGQHRGGIRGYGGRGRGTFGGEVHNFRPEKRNDKTLVVEKIPEDKLSLEQVNSWFKRFGTVTNVAIDAVNAKALVSFSNHDEAHAAWKSEDAVFSNRFVKVFWHRPMEGHGQVGTRMLAASAPLVANMAATQPTSQTSASSVPSVPPAASASTSTSTPTSTPWKASSAPPPTLSALAAKQHRLQETIQEQKTLMASLETASADQKKDIMAKLRKLGEEMKSLTSAASSTPESTVDAGGLLPTSGKKSGFDKMTEHERMERERLDKELDMNQQQHENKTEDLKAKLERLKAEVRHFLSFSLQMLNIILFRQLVWDWMHHYLHHHLVGIEGIVDVDEVHQEVISVVVL